MRRSFLFALLALALVVPRGASAEFDFDAEFAGFIALLSVGVIGGLGSVVTIAGNAVTYPQVDEPPSPSARKWAVADIVFGSLDVGLAIATMVGLSGSDNAGLILGVGVPILGVGATGIGLGASALHRLPDESAGIRVLPVPFVGTAPGGDVYGGVSFVGVGW